MTDETKKPDLTSEEREVFEKVMPEAVEEILTHGVQRRHFLKLNGLTGGGMLAFQMFDKHSLLAQSAMDNLTLYDALQGVLLTQAIAAYFLKLKPENVRVLSPFVGGGFGSKGLWMNFEMAAMAAQAVKRPVKLVLTRQLMTMNVGRRPETSQKVALGAGTDGKLRVIRHQSDSYNNNITQYFERTGLQTKVLHGAPVREITYKIAKLNLGTPTYMRAPGEAPGSFALESAMDELAYELKIDPIEFRVANHTSNDPLSKYPFSSEYLLECYRTGAERFGWSQRKMEQY